MCYNKNKHGKKKGTGFIELAIVIPIILLLIFAAIELGRALRIYSAINVLSKGLASSAFRDCANKTLSPSFQNCLDGVITSTNATANVLLPNATLIVSMYKWDITKAPPNEPIRVGMVSANNTNWATKFNVAYFNPPNSERNKMLKNNEIIVFGEVFFPYSSLLPIAPGIFRFSKDHFYVAAAY